MKTLYLLRHAKSSWDSPQLKDNERPLNKRGKKAAKAICAYMRENGVRPSMVLCSTAERTRQTLKRIRPALPDDAVVVLELGLYLAGYERFLDLMRRVDDENTPSLMMIGHNPETEQVAIDLAGDGDPELLAQMATKYPTGALAVLEAPVERWRDFAPGSARLTAFVRPRDLQSKMDDAEN